MQQPDGTNGRYSAKDTRPIYTSNRKYERLIINNPHGNNSGLRNVSRSMGVTTKNQYTKGNIDSLFKPNRKDNDEVVTQNNHCDQVGSIQEQPPSRLLHDGIIANTNNKYHVSASYNVEPKNNNDAD